MKKVNQFASSKHILALAAIAAGIALPPQAVMASQITHVVQQAGAVKGTVVDPKASLSSVRLSKSRVMQRMVRLPTLTVTSH